MKKPIRRVGVLGSGVMGSGIAAHLANAGLEVLMLDIVPRDLSDEDKARPSARNRISADSLKAALKTRPAPFFHPSGARRVQVGNLEDDLPRLKDCDLVVEAIVERLDIKRQLFERLDALFDDDTIVASNTSGLRIADMLEGRSEGFRSRFLVMHFFNPVRYMKLLELVAGPDSDPAVVERVRRFGEDVLGKGIVVGKDTPNFIGNRIGIQAMMVVLEETERAGLLPEDVDNITGAPMAHPKTGTFRLADLVGIDTFVHVARNCYESLPDDEERDTFQVPGYIAQMVEKNLLGNKTRGGFFKKTKAGIETLDLATLEYRPRGGDAAIKKTTKGLAQLEDPRERVRKLVATDGVVGDFAWRVIGRTLAYAARRVPEIADRVDAIDEAMRWGYSWDLGPFETWDALGFAETVDRMKGDGIALPDSVHAMRDANVPGFYREDGAVYDLTSGDYVQREADPRTVGWTVLSRGDEPVLRNAGAEARDLGDGVLGVRFTTKANSIDDQVIAMLNEATAKAEESFAAMVLWNEGDHFSVGANLMGVVMAANQKQWDDLGAQVKGFQDACQRMKYAKVPVVAAPWGMTLGGGLELCLGSDAVQAAAETYAGLVEVGVGLIPGGGGTMNLVWRALEAVPEGTDVNAYAYVTQVFKNIAMAEVATSAVAAQHKGYFRFGDGVSFDRARHLWEAKQRALGLARSGYHPPTPRAHKLPGESGAATLAMMVDTLVAGGYASEHDRLIATRLAHVLCGGASGAAHEVTEQEVLDLEREAFLSLCGEPKSLERMQHMLMKNKPLRN
ncbi:MAG: 3-hydroxyacyl-CoA dehydrogenase NAD-binding domain-containing protein [Sandaracinaceae bacterium]